VLFLPVAAPQTMHIPDGFLSVSISILFWIVSIAVIGFALRKTSQELKDRDLPLMGILAAAIFAGQMLNFSITGGTSGHLLGAALAVILLGPWAGIVVMTAVVVVQALVFQDGGILALGANVFNMAIVGSVVAYTVYTLLSRLFKRQPVGIFVSGFGAAWASILVASLDCALQLVLSGTSPARVAIPAMAGIHMLIGIGEGLITVGALAVIYAGRKDLLTRNSVVPSANRGVLIGGGLMALVLTVFSPLASGHPDGLEWVAEEHGFIEKARDALYSVIPDYSMPGVSDGALATIIAGIIGVVIVFLVVYGLGRLWKQSQAQN
jgi:cobalt/nickel transport system permease protein